MTCERPWRDREKTARRRGGAPARAPPRPAAPGGRGTDLLAETTLGELRHALHQDLALKADVRDPSRLLDRALLWLHEQEVIRLNKGLAVFRPAMRIRLAAERRGLARADFRPLQAHCEQQVVQLHVIAAANALIAPAAQRMKRGHPISINRARVKSPPGGRWEGLDPMSRGRVQLLPAGPDPRTQAVAVMTELRRLAALDPDWAWSRAAVIAREWRYLEPVRAYCEQNAIPVQMADEAPPHFWRLRETQRLVDWLRGRATRLIDAEALGTWLDQQPTGPWWDLLREGVASYALETSGAELPADHFTEWLAEWGRELRRRQTGLLLLSAHRAKGLELDHVAVLDGGWDRFGRNEDPDAPRRLYYVAMTRARETLTLARLGSRHPFLDALAGEASCLVRAPADLPAPPPGLTRQYRRLGLAEVDLGFAGRRSPRDPVHQAIARLSAGDPLTLGGDGERRELIDQHGRVVGRLARAFAAPEHMACVEARVLAIVVRLREDGDPAYRDQVRCERWEVVVPELVFQPASDTPACDAG